jgi:hypothetical protein
VHIIEPVLIYVTKIKIVRTRGFGSMDKAVPADANRLKFGYATYILSQVHESDIGIVLVFLQAHYI